MKEIPMSFRLVAESPKQIRVIMAVETCSKAILTYSLGHGKSLCFSEVTFLQLLGPDYPVLILPCVDGREFLECAF
jgi:hypothetical protein